MGVQIMQGQKKPDQPSSNPWGAIGTIVGAGVGAYAGGAQGAGVGSQVGGTLGGTAGSMSQKQPQDQSQGGMISTPSDSISRRLSQMNDEPSMVLHQGLQALSDPSVPDEVRQQSAEPMLRAYMKARGIG